MSTDWFCFDIETKWHYNASFKPDSALDNTKSRLTLLNHFFGTFIAS